MIEKIWEILTTLTEEAQNAALAKCKEIGFDPNRGVVSLDESFINLNFAILILKDAIEKKKLIQLPITVQKTLIDYLNAISRFLTSLINGTDEVDNLANSIEQLNTVIWQYGLHNLSEEVLGYQAKMNQLKKQELEIKKLEGEIRKGLNLKSELEQLLAEAKKSGETLQTIAATSDESWKKITENLNRTTETDQKATAVLATIQKTEKEVEGLASTVQALKGKVDSWAEGIEKLSNKSEEIIKNINAQEKELNNLIGLTNNTHKQVESLLPGATSAGLASAFRQRKEEISKSKAYWITGFVLSLLGLLGMVIWIITIFPKQGENNVEWWKFFLQRAPLSFPLIWLGWFFGRNYGHKVRLEEDYAFKESISSSFEGYKREMKEVDPEQALAKLCDNTIFILSESPLRVFDRKTSDETPANSLLERFMPKGKKGQKE